MTGPRPPQLTPQAAEPTGLNPAAPAERLVVGGLTVYWLPKNAEVDVGNLHACAVDETERAHGNSLAHPARRAEFERSRWLARAVLGWNGPLPRSDEGFTVWPEGVVASLSHTQGHVAFVRGDARTFAGLGIDAEEATRARPELSPKIITTSEAALIAAAGPSPGSLAVAFALKEALFKCIFPLGRQRFWFLDAEITGFAAVGDTGGTAELKLLVDASPRTPKGTTLTGHFRWRAEGTNRFVLAAVPLPV